MANYRRCGVAVSPFREKLWELFKEQASGMVGGDVVLLSERTTDAWADWSRFAFFRSSRYSGQTLLRAYSAIL